MTTKEKPVEKTKAKVRAMPAGEFKTHCLSVIDEVHNRREEVVITKHGKPMARLIPLEPEENHLEDIFGFMRGRIRILGDIVSPIDPTEAWDSER